MPFLSLLSFTLVVLLTPTEALNDVTKAPMPKNITTAPPLDYTGPWPHENRVLIDGDVMIGALMMVHERHDKWECGPVMPQGGVQAVEAMIFTINYVNSKGLMGNIPGTNRTITLGAHILDDCDKDSIGLKQAIKFVKAYIASSDGEEKTQEDGDTCEVARSKEKPITGVIGAASSATSIQVANLLKLFQMPQVSHFSSSSELNNSIRFPYFYRTIPSDEFQVEAMVEMIVEFKWTYVAVLYEESSYGKSAHALLDKELRARNVCIGAFHQLRKDSGNAEDIAFETIVTDLYKFQKVGRQLDVVIVFGSDQEVQMLMRAVQNAGAIGKFLWIGSDGWVTRDMVTKNQENAVLGAIGFQPIADEIPGFRTYFEDLDLFNHTQSQLNPWFYEMWEKEYKCKFNRSDKQFSTPFNMKYIHNCDGETERRHTMELEKQLQFVSDAVLVFAYSVKNFLIHTCGHENPDDVEEQVIKKRDCYLEYLPETGRGKKIDGNQLVQQMRNVKFEGLTGAKFSFYRGGKGPPPRYNLYHYRDRFTSNTSGPEWILIGNYTEYGLKIDHHRIQYNLPGKKAPLGTCSQPCPPGHRKENIGQDKCCWSCFRCHARHVLSKSDETECVPCQEGEFPNSVENPIECIISVPETVQVFSPYAIICLILAFIGVLTTGFILIVFVKHNDTPIVKASGRELSYVIIIGLFLCFSVTPLMLQVPSVAVCGLQRLMSGFCFTVVYAALLTKANRIARIFRSGKRTTRRPIFISPQSQIAICCMIASVQLLICGFWMYLSPPEEERLHPNPRLTQIVCTAAVKYSYLLTYVYPILLCIICTVYALQTRRIPEAFNESKYIGVAVYTTCVIWLAFVPIYFVVIDNIPIRITSVCISTSLTAFVCQACLFFPKLYIILLRPERNVRQAVMGPKSSTHTTKNSTYMSACRSESSEGHSDGEENLLEPLTGTQADPRPRLLVTTAVQTSPMGKHAPLAYINSLNDGDIQL